MTLDVVTSVLVLLLLATSTVVFMLGLLGELGVLRVGRCPDCERFVLRQRRGSRPGCMLCRHESLAHPLRTMRHPVRELARH